MNSRTHSAWSAWSDRRLGYIYLHFHMQVLRFSLSSLFSAVTSKTAVLLLVNQNRKWSDAECDGEVARNHALILCISKVGGIFIFSPNGSSLLSERTNKLGEMMEKCKPSVCYTCILHTGNTRNNHCPFFSQWFFHPVEYYRPITGKP